MKLPIVLLSLSVLLLSALGLAAQTKEITEKQFNAIEAKGEKLLKLRPYRLTRTWEHFDDRTKSGLIVRTYLMEMTAPAKWRSVTERFGTVAMREESIRIGKSLYLKDGQSDWFGFDYVKPPKTDDDSPGITEIYIGPESKSYTFLGKVDLDGKSANSYEEKIVRTRPRRRNNTTQTVRHHIRTTRYWFAIDGRLLKQVSENEDEGEEELDRVTTTIDYEAKFKIMSPIK